MSRSYKRPIEKDSSREAKRFANKVVRRAKDVADHAYYKRLYSSWNICDWSYRVEKPNRNGRQICGYRWESYEEQLKNYRKATRK